jgi:hypothetical protein
MDFIWITVFLPFEFILTFKNAKKLPGSAKTHCSFLNISGLEDNIVSANKKNALSNFFPPFYNYFNSSLSETYFNTENKCNLDLSYYFQEKTYLALSGDHRLLLE